VDILSRVFPGAIRPVGSLGGCRSLATEEEHQQERDSTGQSDPQVGVVQRSGRKTRPEVVFRGEAEEKRKEGESGKKENRGRNGPRLYFSSLHRVRTNETTALARSAGMSLGFKSFRVRPVTS